MPGVERVLLPGFVGPRLPDWLERRLGDGLAGVCLFADNIESAAQLARLTDAVHAANPVAVVAVDEEGGDVTRLWARRGAPTPGNAWLGRHDDVGETERQARWIAERLRVLGCDLNLGPCLDVNTDPDNPVIGTRSFGADPRLVVRHGEAWIRGHRSAGVATCAKHFPGHGDTTVDSHLGLPTLEVDLGVLTEREMAPFRAAVAAGCAAVMTGHLIVPAIDAQRPATFSDAVLGLLREELGFAGVVVSDALDMAGASGGIGLAAAAVRALQGGCDLLCLGSYTTEAELDDVVHGVADAVAQGALADARLGEAAARVRRLRSRTVVAGPFGDPLEDGPSLAPGRVAAGFELSARAEAQVARARETGATRWTLVALDTSPGPAVGPTPWGPFAALAEGTDRADRFTVAVPGSPSGRPGVRAPDERVVLVGRDNHRVASARSLVDEWRAADDSVLAVDMGWPGADRRYADIATFGGSRLLGEALVELLAGS